MIQPQITIGQKQEGEAPVIGDNCYIGSGARIIGKITIGDNVTIAPNAIITNILLFFERFYPYGY